PILGAIWAKPVTRLRFPAAARVVRLNTLLEVVGILGSILLFIGMIVGRATADQDREVWLATGRENATGGAEWFRVMVCVIVLVTALRWIRAMNLRAVRIIGRD